MSRLLSSLLDPQPLEIHIRRIEDSTGVSLIRAPVAPKRVELLTLKLTLLGMELCSEGTQEGSLCNAGTVEVEGDLPANLIARIVDRDGIGEHAWEEDDTNISWTDTLCAVDRRGGAGEDITRRAAAGDAADGAGTLTFLAIVDGCEAGRGNGRRRSDSRGECAG